MTNDETSKLLLAKGIEAKAALAEAVSAEKLASDVARVALTDLILAEDAYEAADAADLVACEATNAAKAAYDKVHAEYFESKIVEVTNE